MRRSDPMTRALLTGVILIVVGILAIALGKRVVARTEDVYDQMPALVSGGIGGLALVIIGCVLAYVQVGRVVAEQERLLQTGVIDDVVELTELKRSRLQAVAPAPVSEDEPVTELAEEIMEEPAVPAPRRPRRPRSTTGTAGTTRTSGATRTTSATRRTTRVRSEA